MMNYLLLDETHIQMEFGIFGDVTSYHKFPEGELQSVTLGGKNMVVTHAGELVPAYTETPRRKKKPSVEFHQNGMIKSVYLEEQTEIETPIGTLPAEFVTFYPTGELQRVFVADGQLSGFWTEEEEQEYNIPLSFDFGFTEFTARLNGICFYKSGAVRSVTLYPGETAEVRTPAGNVVTGIGFSLYESGNLKSVEPAQSVLVPTPIGLLLARDPDAIGVNADSNSLVFDEEGNLLSLKTLEHKIMVQTEDENFQILMPEIRNHPLHDERKVRFAMELKFDRIKDLVTIQNGTVAQFSLERDHFTVSQIPSDVPGCSPVDCASCSICNK